MNFLGTVRIFFFKKIKKAEGSNKQKKGSKEGST